jgi:hypothetical protein
VLDDIGDNRVVNVFPVGTALDQLPAGPFLAADCLLQGILFDIRRPRDKLIHFRENFLNILFCEERRKPELILRQSEIHFGTGTAVILCLAEAAPFAAEEVAVTSESKLSGGL